MSLAYGVFGVHDGECGHFLSIISMTVVFKDLIEVEKATGPPPGRLCCRLAPALSLAARPPLPQGRPGGRRLGDGEGGAVGINKNFEKSPGPV